MTPPLSRHNRIAELVARIDAIVAEVTDAAPGRIPPDSHLIQDEGLDSLQLVRLVLAIEERMGVQIELDRFDFDSFTLNKLADHVARS